MENRNRCLVCYEEGIIIKSFENFKIYKCNHCGLEFVNPMPSKEELNKFYANYKNFRAQKRISMMNAQKNFEYLKRYGLKKTTRLLDFGCGENYFIMANSKKWEGYDKYTSQKFPEGKFEFITLFGVLEHLTDPVNTIRNLTEKLEENGKMVMTTVGTETGIPYQYKVPEHVTWWSRKSVELFFNIVGLNVLEISNYQMSQEPDVYLKCILNAGKVPEEYAKKIMINIKEPIIVPTNEIFIVGEKTKE